MTIAEPSTNSARAFDDHHPPDPKLIEDCVHCGFCLPTCPTYLLWGEEMDSPRGRIYLMKLANEGGVGLNGTVVQHFDRCLGCMACVTACPSGVQYDRLIEATRPQVERNYPRSLSDRLFRRLIFELFPYPERLRLLLRPMLLYEKLGLRALAHRLGLVALLPPRLQAMENLLPSLRPEMLRSRLPAVVPARGPRRRRVGMIAGCVQRVFFGDVNAATVRVLAAEGCEVVTPPPQGCCGALELHAGYDDRTLERARRLIALFEQADVDTVVINAAGCGSTLKGYGYLLRDDPAWCKRAEAFSAKVRDMSEILAELEPTADYHPLPYQVAYHDACHLSHAQGVSAQPRAVLGRIPELRLLEIAESDICCGSAGIYNLVQPEAARDLGDRKAQNLLATGAQAVATSNPGCLLQIQNALHRLGRPMPTLHPIELLDASIRGTIPPALRVLRDGR
jgi:glycolate oxidase iron-sulfur subunit